MDGDCLVLVKVYANCVPLFWVAILTFTVVPVEKAWVVIVVYSSGGIGDWWLF